MVVCGHSLTLCPDQGKVWPFIRRAPATASELTMPMVNAIFDNAALLDNFDSSASTSAFFPDADTDPDASSATTSTS